MVACQPAQNNNEDGKQDNFEFSLDQVGRLEFPSDIIDFGDVVIDDERQRFIQVENAGFLPLRFEETFFDEKKFHPSIFYSGNEKSFPGDGGTCPEILPAGESCILAFSFVPVIKKTENVELEIFYNNSLSKSSVKIDMIAYGGEEADLSFSLSSLDYSYVDLDTYTEQTMTITNVGSQHAREFNITISQTPDGMGREMFSIVPATTDCPLTDGVLNIGESCNITIASTVANDQVYDDYQGTLVVEFNRDPGVTDTEDINIDIFQKVVSLEGELKVPENDIGFGDFINFDIDTQSLFVQNSGFNELSVENVTITGDSGSLSIDLTECTERTDERLSGTGKLLLAPGESCIYALVFAPTYPSLPADLSLTDIVFTYDDGKNGLQVTTGFGITADLFAPASLDIQMVADPSLEIWNLGNVFVANDNRFVQTQNYTIRNTGEVNAQNVTLSLSGSPYFNMSHDCPDVLAEDDECSITLNFDPAMTTYLSNGSTLDITSDLFIDYEAGDSDVLGDTKVTTTAIQTTGTMTDGSEIVFSNFDSSTSGSVTTVAGSPAYYDISIKNVGATPESNFDLQMTNITDYFIVDDAGLTFIDGLKNCAHHDSGAGSLFSGEECTYRIRAFSSVVASLSNDLTIDFQAGARTSAAHTYNAEFVSPGKIAMSEPLPASKVVIRSYPTFNYPGEGSATDINDASVTSYFNSSDRSVAVGNMSFPALPVTEVFDLAYIEAGYSAQTVADQVNFQISNDGNFEMEVRDVSIVQAFNLTDTIDVTSMSYFALELSSTATCAGGGSATTISPMSSCLNTVDYTLPDEDLYRLSVNVRYTLGNTLSPTDSTLQEYNSVITLYVQGYDASNYAVLDPTAPASVVSSSQLTFAVVAGGDNTQQDIVNLVNNGIVNATDVHYTILDAGAYKDLAAINSDLSVVGFSPAGAGLDNYYRLASGQCSMASSNEYQPAENCDIDITFNPIQEGTKSYLFVYRYHNGITYVEDSFNILVTGYEPAALVVNNLNGTHPNYENDFAKQIVNDIHTEYVEIRNTGEVAATNVSFAAALIPFSLASSTNPSYVGCTATIGPGDVCYLELNYQPTYSEIEQASQQIFNIAWETGKVVAAVPEVDGMTIDAEGFAEERHSQHQGWTSVDLRGYNAAYATMIQGVITKPNGNSYAPEELGYIHLKWNPMADEGAQTYPITSYAIFKKDSPTFNIHQDIIYDTVNVVGGETEFEYFDENVENTPGKVFYYYILPRRGPSSYISRINTSDYPASVIRVAIPHPYTVGIHRFMASMEACRSMGKDVNDPTNINLANNGCIYQDVNSNTVTYDPNYDVHIDMYEGTEEYMNSASFEFTNNPGFPVSAATYNEAYAACNNKVVSFTTADPILSRDYNKELPDRREHFILSTKAGGYTQEDCEIVDNEIISGANSACNSDFGLENMVGGLPEWTLGQVDGYAKGISTTLADGSSETSMQGINFSFLFNGLSAGFNILRLDDSQNQIDNHCFDIFAGVFAPRIGGSCTGDNLMELTSNSGAETATRWYLLDTEPIDTELSMLFVGKDISDDDSLNIHALAGGGDALDSMTAPNHNYSQFTTSFTFHADDKAGFRCSLRLPY